MIIPPGINFLFTATFFAYNNKIFHKYYSHTNKKTSNVHKSNDEELIGSKGCDMMLAYWWCVYVSGGVIGQYCRSEGGSGLKWVREREN